MAKIVIRNEWFSEGKNNGSPVIQRVYESKQELRAALRDLNTKDLDYNSLIKAIRDLQVPSYLKGWLSLQQDELFLKTHGLSGGIYLGRVSHY
jgi:hypothetical protein